MGGLQNDTTLLPFSLCSWESQIPDSALYSPLQDDLLAELEDLEQEDLEKDLLEVGEPSNHLETSDPLDELPAVRKSKPFIVA